MVCRIRVTAVVLSMMCLIVLVAPNSAAQGIITDGVAEFEYNDVGSGTTGNADFRISGTDNLFQCWWWFRVAGDTAESALPVPDTQSYVGNVATLTWADVGGRGFSATLVVTLTENGGMTGANAVQELLVTNTGGSTLAVEFFNYADFDVNGTAGGDSATLLTDPDHIQITDVDTAEFRGPAAVEFQVTTWQILRTLLNDALVTDLDGTGLPFGPADYTGAFQWSLGLPPQASDTITSVLSVNEPAVPVELMSFSIE